MLPTDLLRQDHDLIFMVMRAVKTEIEKIENNGDIDLDKIEKFVDFTMNFTNGYHESREEKWLFRMLEEHGMPIDTTHLGKLINEHNHFQANIKCISENINNAKNGNENSIIEIKEKLVDYFDTIKGHMYTENNIIYNAADRLLNVKEMHLLENELIEFKKMDMGDKEFKRYKKLAYDIAGKSIN